MDPQARKTALRALNYGLSVLTAVDGDRYAAAGINWISQASFEPPLVMVALKADSDSRAAVEGAGAFAVNVLGEDQLDVAKAFFRSTVIEGDRLNGYRFEPGPATGAPLLTDVAYWFEARVTDTVARGDHTVYVAEVVEAGVRNDGVVPLLLRTTGMNYGG